jgi:dTDP-glucose pyrophosphorylase
MRLNFRAETLCPHLVAKSHSPEPIKWIQPKLNVLIPMAGAGSRFAQAGYTFPKPLIDIRGKPMIQTVVDNLNMDAHFIFIVQKEHYDKYDLGNVLQRIAPGCDIVFAYGMTDGAACTTLLAQDLIDNNEPLVIANSDQYVEWNSNEVMYAFSADQIDGGILTFNSTHPKWSYAKLGDDGFVSKVAEKSVISDNATCGIYYWKRGSDYVKYANQMIDAKDRTNGEFYVCPSSITRSKTARRFVSRPSTRCGVSVPLKTFKHSL